MQLTCNFKPFKKLLLPEIIRTEHLNYGILKSNICIINKKGTYRQGCSTSIQPFPLTRTHVRSAMIILNQNLSSGLDVLLKIFGLGSSNIPQKC